MCVMELESPALCPYIQQLAQADNKENIKALDYRPFQFFKFN